MEISSVDKDPATTYRHYHDRGLIIALYDNEGTLSGFQFPLVDETLPLSSPLATFKEAPRGEIYQDPSVAQNPLVRHTLSEYRIDPARLVHAGSYYKGIDESGDEWIRIALRDRVDLSRLHKYPRKIINSVLEACAILAGAALITTLFFSDLAPDIPYAFLFPLLFDVVAGVYVWNTIRKIILLRKINSARERKSAIGRISTASNNRAEETEDKESVPEKTITDEARARQDSFFLPEALENLGKKDHVSLQDIVGLIKNNSERQQLAIIGAIPYREICLDDPARWTDRRERLFRFCLRYSEVLMNYERIRSEHPSYDLPDLSANFLNLNLVPELIQQLGRLQADLIPLEAGERLLRWASDLHNKKYFSESRQCVDLLKNIRSDENPRFLPEVQVLEKEISASMREEGLAPVTAEAEPLSASSPRIDADLDTLVERKLDLLAKNHLQADRFQGYEPFLDDLKNELNSVEQLIEALAKENTFVIAAASEALGEIADPAATGSLIDVIERDSDLMNWEFTLEKAIEALGHIGDPRAIAPLTALLEHDDDNIRVAAEYAIEEISSNRRVSSRSRQEQAPSERVAPEANHGIDAVYSSFAQNVEKQAILARYDLLQEHAGIMFDKAEGLADIIPRDFLRKCRALFENNKYSVLENIIECELLSRPKNYSYTDDENRFYFVVSPMPWSREEAIENLRCNSTEPPLGYINLFKSLLDNRPSRQLTDFCQFLICLGGGSFELHVCMSRMRGESAQDGFHFTMYPIELLNDEEKRQEIEFPEQNN